MPLSALTIRPTGILVKSEKAWISSVFDLGEEIADIGWVGSVEMGVIT
jgi:hypothetical protein